MPCGVKGSTAMQSDTTRRFCVLLAACALSVLGGCTGHLNQSNGIDGIGTGALPALQATTQTSLADPTPSVAGLDRRNWHLVMVAVPRGQVQVQPTYSEDPTIVHGPARVDGIYPTTSTALDGPSNRTQLFIEGVAQPFWPTVLFFAAPVRMASGDPPGATHQQPRAGFHLVPVLADGQPVWDRGTWAWVEGPPAP